jgi:protein subunit release factor B
MVLRQVQLEVLELVSELKLVTVMEQVQASEYGEQERASEPLVQQQVMPTDVDSVEIPQQDLECAHYLSSLLLLPMRT